MAKETKKGSGRSNLRTSLGLSVEDWLSYPKIATTREANLPQKVFSLDVAFIDEATAKAHELVPQDELFQPEEGIIIASAIVETNKGGAQYVRLPPHLGEWAAETLGRIDQGELFFPFMLSLVENDSGDIRVQIADPADARELG